MQKRQYFWEMVNKKQEEDMSGAAARTGNFT